MPEPRANMTRLHAYVPGEQPTWRDTADPAEPVVKLNTNENPYPPAPAVLEAIRQLPGEALRLYPPPTADRFRTVAGEMLGLSADHVIATNGGDELLRMLVGVFCPPRQDGDTAPTPGGVGMTHPSYSLYGVLADIHDTAVTTVARDPDSFAPPAPHALAEAWNRAGCRLGFFVNPHAPSGRLESLDYLTELADAFDGLLVIDEAYVDFAERDAVPLIRSGREDVVLLRSLSKGYALAGLRFGYGVAHPSVIAVLDKARDSYNTDILSQVAATAALEQRADAAKSWSAVIAERTGLSDALQARGFRVYDSQTNFVLAVPPSGQEAKAIYEGLKARHILIRYFETPGLSDKLRITVGMPDQNALLLRTLDELTASSSS